MENKKKETRLSLREEIRKISNGAIVLPLDRFARRYYSLKELKKIRDYLKEFVNIL